MWSSAIRPAAASTPTWRMPPPSRFRQRRAWSTSSSEPQKMLPTGQARPLDRQKVTVSAAAAIFAALTPKATAALKIRAPSRWTRRPCEWAASLAARKSSSGHTMPPKDLRAASDAAHSQGLDRKSTRLNSSHVSISYAVFCLKKKKEEQDQRDTL